MLPVRKSIFTYHIRTPSRRNPNDREAGKSARETLGSDSEIVDRPSSWINMQALPELSLYFS